MRKKSGFTVMELLIAIAIFGILTAIAVPTYLATMPGYRLTGAASTLRGDLYKAKMLAIKKRLEYRVVFTASDYKLEEGPGWTQQTLRDFSEYPGISIPSPPSPVYFYPRGTATIASIKLQNSKGAEKEITISIAGRIKIK